MSASVLSAVIPASQHHPARGRTDPVGRCASLAAAGLSAASVAVHAVMIDTGGHGPAVSILLAVMALACTGCAAHAVVRPGCRGALTLIGMSIVMALVHAVLVLGIPGGLGMHAMHDAGAHHQGAGSAAAGAGHAGLMLAVVALELAVAWFTAYAVHRSRTGVRGRKPT